MPSDEVWHKVLANCTALMIEGDSISSLAAAPNPQVAAVFLEHIEHTARRGYDQRLKTRS